LHPRRPPLPLPTSISSPLATASLCARNPRMRLPHRLRIPVRGQVDAWQPARSTRRLLAIKSSGRCPAAARGRSRRPGPGSSDGRSWPVERRCSDQPIPGVDDAFCTYRTKSLDTACAAGRPLRPL
jgi:hypothetical protein